MDALHNNWEAWKSINNSNIITSTLTLYFISLCFNGHFSRWTWVSQCSLKQRMVEAVVTTGAISRAKLQSKASPPTSQYLTFYRADALPVAQPTVSKHWRNVITYPSEWITAHYCGSYYRLQQERNRFCRHYMMSKFNNSFTSFTETTVVWYGIVEFNVPLDTV